MIRYTIHDRVAGLRHWDSYAAIESAERQLRQSYSPSKETLEIKGVEVEPLHVNEKLTGSWILWSDGLISRFYDFSNLQSKPKILSPAAESLINEVLGADGGTVHLEGGLLALTRIESETREAVLPGNTRTGGFAGHSITRHRATLKGGEQVTFYSRSVGYSEGYQFDIYPTFKAAKDELVATEKWALGWRDTECLECGATFSEPGSVEPGGMGCVRCAHS